MQLASGCMRVWFANSIPALVGFLQVLWFPLTPKNLNPSIFWFIVSGFSLCVFKALAASDLTSYVWAAAITRQRLENPVG